MDNIINNPYCEALSDDLRRFLIGINSNVLILVPQEASKFNWNRFLNLCCF